MQAILRIEKGANGRFTEVLVCIRKDRDGARIDGKERPKVEGEPEPTGNKTAVVAMTVGIPEEPLSVSTLSNNKKKSARRNMPRRTGCNVHVQQARYQLCGGPCRRRCESHGR